MNRVSNADASIGQLLAPRFAAFLAFAVAALAGLMLLGPRLSNGLPPEDVTFLTAHEGPSAQ